MKKLTYAEILELDDISTAEYLLISKTMDRGYDEQTARKIVLNSWALEYAKRYPELFFHESIDNWVNEMLDNHYIDTDIVV